MHAVMTRGALEKSGNARLAVLRDQGLMIGYRTPFNPLPPLAPSARYEAALKGETCSSDPYGIDVWLEDFGKVFSASWTHGDALKVRLCRPGAWQSTLAAVAVPEIVDAQPTVTKEATMPRKKKAANDIEAAQQKRLKALEAENRKLRREISGLMIDKMILAKAAAGKL
ncbi:MAG TPA: hypothetical protein VG867_02555 [Rhizomicrobium sp.]|nr:hypothetical protein [Rhizomicrobium sp.]